MSTSRCRWFLLLLSLAVFLPLVYACGDASEFRFGEDISALRYEFFHEDEGVHPSKVVLSNPRNPFRFNGASDATKFEILNGGGNAGAFYAWATLLARVPTGEHQFFTATKARDIYNAREVEGADRERIRQIAINGFQVVLDDFPDSVIFDVEAVQTFRLATEAFMGILDLNGEVLGDWILVMDQNGELVAVKGAGVDGQRPGDE